MRLLKNSIGFGLLFSLTSWSVPTRVIAVVNGQPITANEIASATGKSTESALKEKIDSLLAIETVKKEGLPSSPALKKKMDALLYQAFVSETLEKAGMSAEVPDEVLRQSYEKNPLIRVRHLSLLQRTPEERKVAGPLLKEAKADLHRGYSFKKVVLNYSQAEDAQFGGNLDFRGIHNFPEEFYRPLLSARKDAVTVEIEKDGILQLFQWSEKKPFEEAPATYLEILRARIRRDREDKLVAARISELRKTAKIEMNLDKNRESNHP